MPPKHDFAAFEKCCRERPQNVAVHAKAQDSARTDFGLLTTDDTKEFIGANGLTDRVFVKTDPFNAAKDMRGIDMSVDVYDFWTGDKFGYFALVQHPTNKNWLLKSMALNTKPDPKKLPAERHATGLIASRKY